jgi:hypothetical protein
MGQKNSGRQSHMLKLWQINGKAAKMPDELKLNQPWLVAVWPGMGHVAISAGYYLMAKLGMHLTQSRAQCR